MRTWPNYNDLHAGLAKPAGTHGVLPIVAAAPAAPPAAPISQSHHAPDFLEFAQTAGGIGVFNLDLITGDISGSPLFFALIGLPSRKVCLCRDEWTATIYPEDLEAVASTAPCCPPARCAGWPAVRTLCRMPPVSPHAPSAP
jgi:hypothetical protein